MPNAILAPRGSPFVDANNRLTPAWHNYLANIEKLSAIETQLKSGGSSTLSSADLQRLIEISDVLTSLESVIAAYELSLSQRNWAFFYTDDAPVDDSGVNARCTIAHGLSTRKVLARVQDKFAPNGDQYNSFYIQVTDDNTLDATMSSATYQGNGKAKAWVLGLY